MSTTITVTKGAEHPDRSADLPGPREDVREGLFEMSRRAVHTHPLATDSLLAVAVLAFSTAWLAHSPSFGPETALLQAALVVPLVWRRVHPSGVFAVTSSVALVQFVLGYQLIGDVALLLALYTVGVHESRARSFLAAGLLEVGAVMAALRWGPAGTVPRSFLFLSATVVAALFAGLTVASGSRYMAWLAERAERLETERDQQATIAATAERTRIAREIHDIVSHSLSVVVTLADAASVVSGSDPARAAEAMAQVSEVGRHALRDMRAMIGVLRTEESGAQLAPQPDISQLDALIDGVRSTGLEVELARSGAEFAVGSAVELTIYRVVQESLTNTLKHATAIRAWVTIRYDSPTVEVRIADDGTAVPATRHAGHGIEGMRERAALHGGTLRSGPGPDGGWVVSTTLMVDPNRVPA